MKDRHSGFNRLGQPWLFAILATLPVLGTEQVTEQLARTRALEQERGAVLAELETLRARLEGTINAHLLLVHGLTSVIAAHPDIDQEEFSRIAHGLVTEDHALRNIVGAPGLVVTLVYPVAGNEAVVGLDYRSHPVQASAVLRAMRTGRSVVAGPLPLVQGGMGIAIREPVFRASGAGAGERQPWGIVTAVIEIGTLYVKVGIPAVLSRLRLALRSKEDAGDFGPVFFGFPEVLDERPVAVDVEIPGGVWQLAAVPRLGWGASAWALLPIRLVALLVAMAAAALTYLLVRGNRARAFSEGRLRALVDSIPDVVWLKDLDGAYLLCNPPCEELLGASEAEMAGKREGDAPSGSPPVAFLATDRAALSAGATERNEEWLTFARDGRRGLFETLKTPVYDAKGQPIGVLGIAREVGPQRAAEERVRGLNRVHAVLSGIGGAIVRLRDPEALYREVCRIAVEVGGFRMAWVGLADPVTGEVRPVAHAGQVDGYLQALRISLADNARSSGPTGEALRQGAHMVCNDIARDPRMGPWRDAALRLGYHASAAFPIVVGGRVHGAFNLYADRPGFFDTAELGLLDGLASDIGFALELVETERAREALNRRLVDLLETMSDGFLSLGPDGHCRYVNRQAAELLGRDPSRLLGKPIWGDDPVGLGQSVRAACERALGEGRPIRLEDYDAERGCWLEHRIFPTPEGVSVLFTDVTERIRTQAALEEQRREADFLATLLERSSQAMAVALPDGRLGRFNEAFVDLVGYPREELLQIDWMRDLTPAHWLETERASLDLLHRTGEPVRYEKEYIRKDGRVIAVELYTHEVSDASGAVAYYYAFVTDISERKRTEDEIRQLNAELEDRVAARTAELAAINRELETFTYSVSHDLKAPLRGIDGYSRLLLDDYAARLDEEGRVFLRNVRQCVEQMGELIDDLLAYSRMERRELRGVPLDLATVAARVLAEREEEIKLSGARVTVELDGLTALADPDGLAMVLRNLLDNALKFRLPEAPPSVEIRGKGLESGVLVAIRDRGIGFDMRFHERIFDIFQRLQRAEDYPGTGIGLAIVRKAVQRMGGRVWAESASGQGATFFLELPR